jgi:hypothetical protein
MVDSAVLRSDNGGNLKATTVLAVLSWLGDRRRRTRGRAGPTTASASTSGSRDRSKAPQLLYSELLTLCLPGAKQGIFNAP